MNDLDTAAQRFYQLMEVLIQIGGGIILLVGIALVSIFPVFLACKVEKRYTTRHGTYAFLCGYGAYLIMSAIWFIFFH